MQLHGLLTISEVCETVALSRAKVYRLVKDKAFPQPVKLGSASRWAHAEVQAWIGARLSERSGGLL